MLPGLGYPEQVFCITSNRIDRHERRKNSHANNISKYVTHNIQDDARIPKTPQKDKNT